MKLLTHKEAALRGLTCDDYANIAYKGPRFAPTEWCSLLTEREELYLKLIQRLGSVFPRLLHTNETETLRRDTEFVLNSFEGEL